ncbi:MAG: purH [Glaciihabitans sp.]|nr:purH [Glaciihabitans sp.]
MSGPSHDPALYRPRDVVTIRRALVSVSDKTGLVELATALAAANVEIVSTGSTAATIAAAGIPVTEVAAVTGYPESLDGRVRTLHPAIHSGLLADLRLESHERELAEQGIAPFELVVSNLYPFVQTINAGVTGDAAVEQIDIGGPAMVRASAKNHANVAIVTSPDSYQQVTKALSIGGTTLRQRRRLAAEAFAHTAAYDAAVAAWFATSPFDEADNADSAGSADVNSDTVVAQGDVSDTAFSPEQQVTVTGSLQQVLRYGENSHQSAALYLRADGHGIAQAEQLHGKEMSFNNYVDADAALRAAYDFDEPAVAIIKHANPCGIAIGGGAGDPIATAHHRAHECDPVSAFGGVIAANRIITIAAAEAIKDIFTEVVVAPGFEPAALELLSTKKNLRLLQLPADYSREATEVKQISGGLLVQQLDTHFAPFENWTLATGEPVDDATRDDLVFAWRAVRAVKSNGILLAHNGASVGVGMGQVNRVDSCHLAVNRAGERAAGSVAASDAFFPFADGLQVLLDAGVRAVVQPGGSVRDAEVIAAAEAAGVTMYFTGERHFFH